MFDERKLISFDLGQATRTEAHPTMRQRVSAPSARNGYRRAVVLAAAGVLLAAGSGIALQRVVGRREAPAAAIVQPIPIVAVTLPVQRSVVETAQLAGQLSPVNQVVLRSQVSGYLTEIHFEDGRIVQKGDLLFQIDPRPYETLLQQAVAQHAMAVASLDLANKQVSRAAQLHRDQFVSTEVLDQRTQSVDAASANVQSAMAAIRAAQLNLEFTRIAAPFDGRMSKRRVSVGSLVNGGATAADATILSGIVSLDPIRLDFDMSEADFVAYQHGLNGPGSARSTAVQVGLSGESAWSRVGNIDFIDNQIDRSSGAIHARATLSNPGLVLVPGRFASVRIPVSEARMQLLIPDAAVATDQSGKVVMVVQDDGVVMPRKVVLGALQDNDMRVIAQGLEPTDRVVVNDLMRVRPGMKVTPQS